MKTKQFILSLATMVSLTVISCGGAEKEESKESDSTLVDEAEPAVEEETVVEEKIEAPVVIDQRDPEKVMEGIFAAAESGDYASLAGICAADCDGDCKNICTVATADDKKKEEFKSYFANGIVTNTEVNGDKATVDFTFGPDGKKAEKMKLVLVGGKWFIHSF